MINSRVERIDAERVWVSGQRIASRTVFWAAGVVASPAAKWLQAEADKAGRLKVESDLSVPGFPDVFAIGDTALAEAWNGRPVPGLAPAAKQGGAYVARVIRARIEGSTPPGPFAYRHLGGTRLITGGEVQAQEPVAASMPQSPDALSALPRVGAPFKHS